MNAMKHIFMCGFRSYNCTKVHTGIKHLNAIILIPGATPPAIE